MASEAFEYLLGCPEITQSDRLRALLWKHQTGGGFEDALAELQQEYRAEPLGNASDIGAFQSAVHRMFDEMNRGYLAQTQWEFQQHQKFSVTAFLTRFNAIFSLNQDLLIEQHYLNDNVSLMSGGRWDGWQLPGLELQIRLDVAPTAAPAAATWIPRGQVQLDSRLQPYVKLHGSSNWRDPSDTALMVVGGNKAQEIAAHSILNEYLRTFESHLSRPNTRLMVIGYSFRDHHINKIVERAVYRHSLKMFVISPQGSDLARTWASSVHPGAAMVAFGYDLEDVFIRGLVGASRRPLREIFGGDHIEHAKVMRFFEE